MGYHVLVVDDMFVNRKLIKSVLKQNIDDVRFIDAEDGIQALEALESQNIDLVILDLMLPFKNGYDVLNEMKSQDQYQDIPVIVNSAINDLESLQKTFELGAIDYFTKPLSIDEMRVILPLKVKNALKYYEQKKLLIRMNEQMKNELKIAKVFQSSLMPEFRSFPSYDMYGKYLPCKEVGGDLYDCAQINDSLWFIIGDVTGHGVTSAMVSSMVKVLFNNCIQRYSYPSDILEEMNRAFCNILEENTSVIFSAFVGVIRNHTLYYSNAGHPYPIVLNPSTGESIVLKQNGFLIGVFENTKFSIDKVNLKPGSFLLSYTDGLFDTRGSSASWDQVFEESQKHVTLLKDTPVVFLNRLIETFWKQESNDYNDDITMLLIKVKP